MELEILIKEWRIKTKEDKSRTVAGTYAVMCNANEVATSTFNDGYNSTDIQISAELLVEAESLDEKIKNAITKNFMGGK